MLDEAGVTQRLIVRDPTRVSKLINATVVQAGYSDGDDVSKALDGVDVLLMVSGTEGPDRLAGHQAFIEAAARAGVRHVAYTAFFGAAPDATFTITSIHSNAPWA